MTEIKLYDLTPQEFERLVADLLPESGYSNVRLGARLGDREIDILADKSGKDVAFEVKHKRALKLSEVRQFALRFFSDPTFPRSLVYVTSAELPTGIETIAESLPDDVEISFLGRSDIEQLLLRRPSTQASWLDAVTNRLKHQQRNLWLGLLGAAVSVSASLFTNFIAHPPAKERLDKRIETVENVLSNIRDLESYLSTLKEDMTETERATALINQKYTQAQELEKLTDKQILALQATLQTQSWHRTILNYVLGFIFGVASSFVSSVLYSRWQQRKSIE